MRDFRTVPGPLDFGPFLALPEDARRALSAHARDVVLAPAQRLLVQGDAADAAFVLLGGLLRIEAGGTFLKLVSPPAVVGEMAILERQPRNASAVAEAECRLLRIDAPALLGAAAEHPAFAEALAARVAELSAHTFLRKDSPFGDLPGDMLDQLAHLLRPVVFTDGQLLFREGDRDDDIYLIRRGSVEVLHQTTEGERRLATLGPGQFVGETAALTGAPRSATVRAKGGLDAYRLAAADVRPLLQRHAALVERFGDALNVRHRPRRAERVSAIPSPDEADALILRNDENGRYLKVSRDAHAILEDLDGERTLRDLVLRHLERTGEMDPPGVFRIVATLQASGFASAPRAALGEADDGLRLKLLDLLLAPRLELRSADGLATALHRVLRPLATRPAVLLAIALGVVGAAAFVPQARGLSLDTFGLGGIVVAWAGLLVAGVGHELAHLLACKAFGSRLGRAGVGLMWFSPLIYVDTTDTWTLGRGERILVNAAGPIFNFSLAGAGSLAALASSGLAADLLLWLAGMNYLAVLFNLSPLLEFDGYYVLSDIANTPMLRRRALHFVFRQLVERPRLPRSRFEWGLVAFSLAFVVYGLALTGFVMLTVPPSIARLLSERLAPEWVTPAWLLAALVVLALTIGPLIDNIVAARGWNPARVSGLSAGSAVSSPARPSSRSSIP